MATWKELSLDSLAAAKELMTAGHWRSSASRSYYAVYARVCQVLSRLTEFPEGREGPSHDDLPDMLFDYLTRLTVAERRRFASVVYRMYQRRVTADYRPSRTIDELGARDSMTSAQAFFTAMEAVYE